MKNVKKIVAVLGAGLLLFVTGCSSSNSAATVGKTEIPISTLQGTVSEIVKERSKVETTGLTLATGEELNINAVRFHIISVLFDEIAERILTLEGEPLHTFSDYLQSAEIKEEKSIVNGNQGIQIIINNYKVLIAKERAILSLASTADDEGTVSLMSDYISQTEKTLWMLNSYMS